ncbi:MAG TPA: GNAT family N-acyltransferase [Blastocatellia bacterium]|nr:GNAT family N-acyltransferase [Blastocatellia bacterium]
MDSKIPLAWRATFASTEEQVYPANEAYLPQAEIREGRYLLRFARNRHELDAVLKLRFEVFNLELGEGLESSFQTGRDLDEFDLYCHHLIVVETSEEKIVGTYRVQTGEMAGSVNGFYSDEEFDLSLLPRDVLEESIELGRACIAREHRNTQVLFLLWRGIAAYMLHNRKRYLFGCCSLTSQDPREGLAVMDLIERAGQMHSTLKVAPRASFECIAEAVSPTKIVADIPRLFRTYLRFGAKVCGPPAIDRRFKTIDFLVIFDIADMDGHSRRVYFDRSRKPESRIQNLSHHVSVEAD